MMGRNSPAAAAAVVALILASALGTSADDKTILIELDSRNSPLPTGVSASGAVMSGTFSGGLGGYFWMPTTGVVFAGGVAADAISRDGRTIVGWAKDARGVDNAAIWLRGSEWRLLGSFPNATPCDSSLSLATGASGDGQVVVGQARRGCTVTHAFRWEESTGMVDLGSGEVTSSAQDVSADGRVVVGYQRTATGADQGVRWVNGRTEVIPGAVSEGFVGLARGTNHGGSVVVGRICRPQGSLDQSAWIWTAQDGTRCLPAPRFIESPGPAIIVEANAASDDGQVVGGAQNVGGSTDSNAIIWIGGRAAYLKDFLRANGVPDAFRDWFNTGEISAITPDGRVIAGYGAAIGGYRGYLIILGSSRVIP